MCFITTSKGAIWDRIYTIANLPTTNIAPEAYFDIDMTNLYDSLTIEVYNISFP